MSRSESADAAQAAVDAFARGEPVLIHDAADRPPAVVVCEMLDDETGGALSPAEARAYATEAGLHYVEGRAIIAALE